MAAIANLSDLGMTDLPQSNQLRVLRLVLSIEESSAPYNQFSLPLASEQNITICSYFPASIPVHKDIKLIEGDGSIRGYFRALFSAGDGFDVVHAHAPHVGIIFLIVSWLVFRRILHSTVYTVHSSYTNYKWRNKLILIPVFMGFRRIVYCSTASYESFPNWIRRLATGRDVVIPNGVDLARIDRVLQVHQQQCTQRTFTVVTIGRLIRLKRPLDILEAYKKCEQQMGELFFIGDGTLKDDIALEIERRMLHHRVHITGKIPRDRVFEHLACADLFISTSEVEGLPVAVLEAMACNCPVILSDIPPHREIARDANFIPLVSIGDVESLVHHIRRYSEMSPSERMAIGAKCREIVVQRYSLESMLTAYLQVYNAISKSGEQFAGKALGIATLPETISKESSLK